jgi:hypothetical protein
VKKTDIQKAQDVLDELNAQRDALIARGYVLEERRQEISFLAHTGAKKERAQLDLVNSEAITHEYELKSLESAIQEATKRLAAADAAQALAQDKENARALRAVVDKFVAHSIALDEAFQQMTAEANALREVLIEIHGLGCQFPSFDQLNSLGARALGTAIMNTPWKRDYQHLAPSERQSFPKLVSDWADRIEKNHIQPRIGELEVA